MCLSPIVISKPQLPKTFIRQVYDAQCDRQVRGKLYKSSRSFNIIPCGKCVECLKSKQNDLAVRCVREAQRCGNMVFVTLTYDEDTLPIACSSQLVDTDTGEVVNFEVPVVGKYKDVRHFVTDLPVSKVPRYYHINDQDFEHNLYCQFSFTPSLDRRDFRLYLKRERLRYEREEGCKLPPFKYVAVGEYGPKTCRPHYHIAFFGLDQKLVFRLFRHWKSKWMIDKNGLYKVYKSGPKKGCAVPNPWYRGFIFVENVNCINKDGSSGFTIASKYVGKYMCKGKFDCKSVVDGMAEKPRICISADLGTVLSDQEINYYRAFDMFGYYHPDDLRSFDSSMLDSLCSEINKRSYVSIGDCKYSLPRGIRKKLFYKKRVVYDRLNRKNVIRYEATSIQDYRLALLRGVFADCLLAELRKNGVDFSSEDFNSAVQQAYLAATLNSQVARPFKEKDFLAQYSFSKF